MIWSAMMFSRLKHVSPTRNFKGWLITCVFIYTDIQTYIWSCCSHGLAREEISNLKAQYKASGFYENKEDISVSETFHGSCLGLISIVTAAVKTTKGSNSIIS